MTAMQGQLQIGLAPNPKAETHNPKLSSTPTSCAGSNGFI
jgi:hypothetical protein